MKFISKWLDVAADDFPLMMARTVISLVQWQDENIKKRAIEILKTLAIRNIKICTDVGGIRVLCDSVVDPSFESCSEDIMHTLIFLLNKPDIRNKMIDQFQIQKIFSYFSDIERVETLKSTLEPHYSFEIKLRLASKAIITFFKTWSGLIYLGWEKRGLKSLIEALRQPINGKVRECIFELLDEIIKIGVNLCPKESERKNSSIRRYLSQYAYTQTKLLLDAGTYDILLELSSIDDLKISSIAQKLLRNLTVMM